MWKEVRSVVTWYGKVEDQIPKVINGETGEKISLLELAEAQEDDDDDK